MRKSDRGKWTNIIQQMVDSNYKLMTDKTKENLFEVSNAIFSDKKNF